MNNSNFKKLRVMDAYLFFYWSIVGLKCHVNFWSTAKKFSYTYVYTFFLLFSIVVYHKILSIVPCAIQYTFVVNGHFHSIYRTQRLILLSSFIIYIIRIFYVFFIFDKVEFIRTSIWELFCFHYFNFSHLFSYSTRIMFTLEKLKAREEHKKYIHYIEYKKAVHPDICVFPLSII